MTFGENAQARQLVERGYALFEDLLDEAEVRALRGAVEGLIEALSPASFYAAQESPISERAALTPAGLAIHHPLREDPTLGPLAHHPEVDACLRALLGEDLRIETEGAVVSDQSRPFFGWHTHIDGEEEGTRVRRGVWPAIGEPRRVLTLLYLDDLDERTGPLYVLPRRLGDPTEPPFSLEQRRWPGMEELLLKAGTMVALEQCTWHAAGSLSGPGHRIFVGCYWVTARESEGAR